MKRKFCNISDIGKVLVSTGIMPNEKLVLAAVIAFRDEETGETGLPVVSGQAVEVEEGGVRRERLVPSLAGLTGLSRTTVDRAAARFVKRGWLARLSPKGTVGVYRWLGVEEPAADGDGRSLVVVALSVPPAEGRGGGRGRPRREAGVQAGAQARRKAAPRGRWRAFIERLFGSAGKSPSERRD